MYKDPGGTVDREEYLLGRAIDKSFEQMQHAEKASASSKNTVELGIYLVIQHGITGAAAAAALITCSKLYPLHRPLYTILY
jgi:uncharacterized MAPEG superfamily protein